MKWLINMVKDWKKTYKENPSSEEARETFRLLFGIAKAKGISQERFEEIWNRER